MYDGVGELLGSRLSSNIFSFNFPVIQNFLDGVSYHLSVVGQVDVVEELRRAKHHGRRIRYIFPYAF